MQISRRLGVSGASRDVLQPASQPSLNVVLSVLRRPERIFSLVPGLQSGEQYHGMWIQEGFI